MTYEEVLRQDRNVVGRLLLHYRTDSQKVHRDTFPTTVMMLQGADAFPATGSGPLPMYRDGNKTGIRGVHQTVEIDVVPSVIFDSYDDDDDTDDTDVTLSRDQEGFRSIPI